MLSVDLGLLEREGFVDVEAVLPPEADLWAEADLRWAGDVDVKLRATFAGTGEVVVRGRVSGVLEHECRRCLEPGTKRFASDLTLVFVDEGSEVDGQDGAYAYEQTGAELDMSRAVREEVILAMNPYVVCKPECKGLCPRCGTNLNAETCDCIEEDVDPRWEALRNMKSE
jgi:DUF177 domain-containing protein